MNRSSVLVGMAIGGASVLSVGAVGSYVAFKEPRYAEVLSAKPVTETVSVPEQECHDVQVLHRKSPKDPDRIAGTVIGGVIGGVVGSQIGRGTGKTLATVGGAAAGGYAGNRIQKNMQDKDTYVTAERQCKTVTRVSEKIVGYDVDYRLSGHGGTVRMDHKPGERIPVKDGKLVLTESEPGASAN
jgi:uncharacterized protein YcfJ